MLGDLGKLIVAKGLKKLPKVQKIARSGHTGYQGFVQASVTLPKDSLVRAVVVAQMAPPIPEGQGSNPVIGNLLNNIYLLF